MRQKGRVTEFSPRTVETAATDDFENKGIREFHMPNPGDDLD
ncbi:MAG: hypothetical protein ABI318_10805 [Chthoniobacteraceae bacterium]